MKLSGKEIEAFLGLVKRLTGHGFSASNHLYIVQSFEARLEELGLGSLKDYLPLLDEDPKELERFIAISTIHTTSWFRDHEQLTVIEDWLKRKANQPTIRVWSAACSTGQEVYSIGMILESLRLSGVIHDYSVVGSDIDRLSLGEARLAEYPAVQVTQIPDAYLHHICYGENEKEGFFQPAPEIMERCRFLDVNLLGDLSSLGKFDLVLLRNVLFYFDPKSLKEVVRSVEARVSDEGLLGLGLSDFNDASIMTLSPKGSALYSRERKLDPELLIIDDSDLIQAKLKSLFGGAGFTTTPAYSLGEASALLPTRPFQAITLDVNLPDGNGLHWLQRYRETTPIRDQKPVIIISDLTKKQCEESYETIVAQAEAYFEKGQLRLTARDLLSTTLELLKKQHSLVQPTPKSAHIPSSKFHPAYSLILVGASTGGPKALSELLHRLPRDTPPIVIVQHLDSQFQAQFVHSICTKSGLQNGMQTAQDLELRPGHVYAPLGNEHIGVETRAGRWYLRTIAAPPRNKFRPSIDVLFESVRAEHEHVIGILMTGMGKDGAEGLKALQTQGALTFAQDEASCVVFGMPGEAQRLQAADFIGSPHDIRAQLLRLALKYKLASGL